MTDKELIELAAKAAGIEVRYQPVSHRFLYKKELQEPEGFYFAYWNPLTDDGDALRLVVKLKMRIAIDSLPVGYVVVLSDDPLRKDTHEPINDDPYAATRRAIVRAAAELARATSNGKAM